MWQAAKGDEYNFGHIGFEDMVDLTPQRRCPGAREWVQGMGKSHRHMLSPGDAM